MRGFIRRRVALAALLSFSLLPQHLTATAQQQHQPTPQRFELTVDRIMRGPELVGYSPASVQWSQDSQRVYFRWKRAGEPRLKEPDLYVVNRDGT